MHFDILVEDQSGKKALEILVPKIIGEQHTCRILSYNGIGHIPPGLTPKSDPQKRILLDQLPRLLQGFGKTYNGNPSYAVIVVCDLDDKCLSAFRKELLDLLDKCKPRPEARFCIAVEEGEAWFLGDKDAIKKAYPNAKDSFLNSYDNDSICGTWECLANAVFPGGVSALSSRGKKAIGSEKSLWSEKIAPCMNVDLNESSSFKYFRDKLREFLVHSSA